MENEKELIPKYDKAKSFYKKAIVTEHKNIENQNIISLYSYNTLVCYIIKDINNCVVKGIFSDTTLRHIKEFLKQNDFKAETKKQIKEDYIKI